MDWLWDALSDFQRVMDAQSTGTTVLCTVLAFGGAWLLTAVHELGHLVATVACGVAPKEMRVGTRDDVVITAGRLVVRLGRHPLGGEATGHVSFDPRRMTPTKLALIAAAGPGANVLTTFALLIAVNGTSGWTKLNVAFLAVMSAMMVIGNLIPRGWPDQPGRPSDGRLIQLALQVRGAPGLSSSTEGSIPPPGY